MARLKLKQILSNLHYDATNDQLILSSSKVNNIPDFVIKGNVFVTSGSHSSGSLTINGVDTFGDSGSFDTIDLGEY